MSSTVYWQAPLWQVALLLLVAGLLLGWLAWRALRRPDAAAALAEVDPALETGALFHFDGVHGVTGLTAGARELLAAGGGEERDRLLVATLLRAFETGRSAQQPDWPEAGSSLVALPLGGAGGRVAGVLGLVAAEQLAPPHEAPAPEAEAAVASWLPLGQALRLSRTRPIVQVRSGASPEWETRTLSHTEEAVLRHLAARPGEVQAAEQLFGVAWPDESVSRHGLRPDQRDRLRRLVFQLRQHVEPEPGQPRYVGTAHGVGYVLYADGEGVPT
jgi:hypothetical protein